jgi:CheY-like chemotaxis protein
MAVGDCPMPLGGGAMRKILVVDDDVAVLLTAQAVLEEAGFKVLTRNTGLGTSQVVLQHRPDAVLLDVNMPGLNGLELARLLQKLPRDRPALILHSGMDRGELARAAAQVGAVGYISKSAPPSRFVVEILALLDTWRQQEHRAGRRTALV